MTTKHRQKKAAFQLSLGFIVAVVFAIVLLSLAIAWITGVLEDIMVLTDDLTQEAQSTLRDAFRSGSSSSFAIWPSQYTLEPGKAVRMSAGIENDAQDGQSHLFVINVIPAAADENVLSASGCSSFESCSVLNTEMKKWATFDNTAGRADINAVSFKYIEVRPAGNAVKGTYIFNVVACYDKTGGTPSSSTCTVVSENLWGGTAQQLIISVV